MPRLLRIILLAGNLFAAVAFLLVCFVPWLNPGRYWYIAVLGLVFPFIVLALLVFFTCWLFAKSKWAILSLLLLVAGWGQVHVLFGIHLPGTFTMKKHDNVLRVLQWNVSRLDQMNPKRKGGSYRQPILDYIAKVNPDILCLEEFLESNNPREFDQNIPYITSRLGFPYHFFARDHRRWDGVYEHGVIIFSKYPLLDTLRIRYAGPDSLRAAESLIHVDVAFSGKRVRVFATHLQSLRFDGNDYQLIRTMAKGENNSVDKSKGLLRKFRLAYQLRSRQAELVRREMDDSPYPVITCGDFNDVPNSFTYFKIKGACQDAFLERGFGIGRTFASISPTLRIDYVLAGEEFSVLQCHNEKLPYSDHYPVTADFVLQKQ